MKWMRTDFGNAINLDRFDKLDYRHDTNRDGVAGWVVFAAKMSPPDLEDISSDIIWVELEDEAQEVIDEILVGDFNLEVWT